MYIYMVIYGNISSSFPHQPSWLPPKKGHGADGVGHRPEDRQEIPEVWQHRCAAAAGQHQRYTPGAAKRSSAEGREELLGVAEDEKQRAREGEQ